MNDDTERVLECKIKICSGCGKEVMVCEFCGKPFEINDEIICVVVGFDRVKHYHNYQKCFPKLKQSNSKNKH